MKVLLISLAASFFLSTNAMANDQSIVSASEKSIPTIVVVAKPEAAQFEVYSLRHAQTAIDGSIEMMVKSFSSRTNEEAATVSELAASAGSAI